MTAQHSTNCSSFSVKKNCIVIILDFPTDRGENAACQDCEVSEWGGDNILITTQGAMRWAEQGGAELPSLHLRTLIHACYITYES